MNGSLSRALQEHLIAYLEGATSHSHFQDWLVGATWSVEEQNDPQAVEMTYEIKLAIAECSRGDISAEQFRERLRQIAETDVPVARAVSL
jgi:hypothetical protein